jgi:hypothetical protein
LRTRRALERPPASGKLSRINPGEAEREKPSETEGISSTRRPAMKGELERDEAEYAQAIAERDEAVATNGISS